MWSGAFWIQRRSIQPRYAGRYPSKGEYTISKLFSIVHGWYRRLIYRKGKVVSRFIARDVKRCVLVESTEEIDAGFIVCRIRTYNLLYNRFRVTDEEDFGSPKRIAISKIWRWTGKPWGGLPDGTSIAGTTPEEYDVSGQRGE